MQILLLHSEGNFFALLDPFQLVWGRGTECGVEGNICRVFPGWPRLDVAAALAVRVRARATAALLARDFVYGIIEFARGKRFTRPDFLPSIPPMGIAGIENLLRPWFRSAILGFGLANFLLA